MRLLKIARTVTNHKRAVWFLGLFKRYPWFQSATYWRQPGREVIEWMSSRVCGVSASVRVVVCARESLCFVSVSEWIR